MIDTAHGLVRFLLECFTQGLPEEEEDAEDNEMSVYRFTSSMTVRLWSGVRATSD